MKKIIHPPIRFFIRVTSYFFFEKMVISGSENLPDNCPVIFACNHPNAFLDSIVMTTCAKRPLYYTARGDFFKSKIASVLLHFINILPVYRREEGRELMYKNNETFSYCIELFKKNGALVIFSEGLSENKYELRPLRKGTARLAFEAWNNPDIGNRLKVVPVAIHYSSWLKICPRVYVEFLENIERKSFSGITESGLFNRKFNEKLKSIFTSKCIMVNKSGDVALQNRLVGYLLKNFSNGVELAKKIEDRFLAPENATFKTNYNRLAEFLSKENISYYKEPEIGIISFSFSILAFSAAYILNALPYLLSKFIVRRATKENDFHDSLFYCVLWLVYCIYIIILFSVFSIYLSLWSGISIVILAVLSASVYEASKRNIQCFLKRDKLKTVKQLLNQLFETNND